MFIILNSLGENKQKLCLLLEGPIGNIILKIQMVNCASQYINQTFFVKNEQTIILLTWT